MRQYAVIAESYPGWPLSEIQALSPRERKNWLEMAKEYGKVVRG
jgi:hypothetical protein